MILPQDPNASPTGGQDTDGGPEPPEGAPDLGQVAGHPVGESDPGSGTDSPEHESGWAPFDPGDAPQLPGGPGGSGRVVAVVASAELIGVGWALSVAVELARTWSRERFGVVLVDTDFARPRMHHTLRVDNAIGLAEVLSGDAPVSDATRAVEDDRLYCVPAGNTPGEPEDAFDFDRWSRFCRAFADAGMTVVAYVPANVPWASAVLAGATEVVEVREQDRELGLPVPHGRPVLAELGPMSLGRPPQDPTGKDPVAAAPLLGFDGADLEEPVYPTDETPEAAPVLGLEPVPAREDRPVTQGPRDRGNRDKRRRRTVLAYGIVLGGLVLILTLRALGLGTAVFSTSAALGGDRASAAADGPGEARPIPPGLRFSVAVASYGDRERAQRRADELAAAVPEITWYLAPVLVDGREYQRVLGGLAPDSSSATLLASHLAERLGAGPDGWIVRNTEVVLDLGEATDRGEAEAEAARLRGLGVPAVVTEVAYSDRSVRYRIQAGGYADATEASHLLATVRALGVDASTSARLGTPAP